MIRLLAWLLYAFIAAFCRLFRINLTPDSRMKVKSVDSVIELAYLTQVRYYVYSIEYGYMPNNPYFESDDIDECISVANAIHEKHNVCVYVVDTKPCTMYDEVYVKISSDFREVFDERFRRRKRLS